MYQLKALFVGLFVFAVLWPMANHAHAEIETPPVSALQEVPPPAPNLFAKHFYMNPDQIIKHEAVEAEGFVFVEAPNFKERTRYAVVTDFGGNVLRTTTIPEVQTAEDMRTWIKANLATADYKGVEIQRLEIPSQGGEKKRIYWVGHKSFSSADEASVEIERVKKRIEFKGGNFKQMVQEAKDAFLLPDQEAPVQVKSDPQYLREEKLMLKYMDQLQIGSKLFGPFQGDATGEPLVWQSFGETTWRQTNFEGPNFNSQVGFWTNRFVFKGIRAPLSTVNPYLETTTSIEGVGQEFKSNIKFFGGLEWRPFARNPWLANFRPWGGIAILEWIRNYRFYLQYGVREAIKDEIDGSDNHDLLAGVQIFYEWGVELPPLDERPPTKFSEYIEQYIWGEYFGNYRYEMTNFGSEEDFDAWILNSSLILGFKMPAIPMPPNPINDELVLMPYLRAEHVNNSDFSFPFQNRYSLATGVRWMPFRSYKHKENEWLSKTKVFIEYVGIGKTQHAKQSIDEGGEIRYDLRVGVNISSRRY